MCVRAQSRWDHAIKAVNHGGKAIYHGRKAAGWWVNQQDANNQEQVKAEVVSLSCTPVQVNSCGEVTFLTHKFIVTIKLRTEFS